MTAAGCEKTFSDTASGRLAERPELTLCLGYLRAGDVLVVWRLDRLGRSLRHLVKTVNALAERGVAFASLHEGIDTTTSTGRLIFHIFAALAEFERELIAERAAVGRQAARARGRLGGRPAKLSRVQVELAWARYDAGDVTVVEIAPHREIFPVGPVRDDRCRCPRAGHRPKRFSLPVPLTARRTVGGDGLRTPTALAHHPLQV